MKKLISISLIFIISVGVATDIVWAKTKIVSAPAPVLPPQVMMSWSAQSLVPSWYQGKIFPNRGSKIDVAVELLDNGRIVDLSQNKVRWYINNNLVVNENNGLGIKNYSFKNFDYPGTDIEVRVVIMDYKNAQSNRNQIGGEIIIPIAHSEVVIDAPYPGKKIDHTASFVAYPFFFDIPDASKLSFDWTANGVAAQADTTNPRVLNFNIDSAAPSGLEVDLSIMAKNLANDIDFAGDEIKLNLK